MILYLLKIKLQVFDMNIFKKIKFFVFTDKIFKTNEIGKDRKNMVLFFYRTAILIINDLY